MVTKYQWGAACRFFPGFRDSSGVQRTAGALVDLYNETVNCAYPTRETLSQQLGAAPEAVSKWLRLLREGGALSCVPLHILPPEAQTIIGRSARRAQVYLLNFGWAYEVLGLRDEYIFDRRQRLVQKVIVQSPLPMIGVQAVTPNGIQSITSAGNYADTLIPYEHTLGDILEGKEGSEQGSNLSVYTRERAA